MARTSMAPRSRPRYESVDIPAPFIDLAQRRTEFLFHVMTWGDKSMRIVLASTYLQGINDVVDAMDNKAKRESAPIPDAPIWQC